MSSLAIRRRFTLRHWALLGVLLAVLLWVPRLNTLLRLLTLLTAAALWLGALALGWRRKPIRAGLLAAALALGIVLLLPGRPAEPEALRQAYLAALRSFEGVEYVWGGERSSGIDCSGLVRAAMLRANLREAVRTLNPGLLREALALWLRDSSARNLRQGYAGRTRFLHTAKSLDALDHAPLLPGDLAVTADGVHVLAYLGGRLWIEADPLAGRVISVAAPAPRNQWFSVPVDLMRWTALEPGHTTPGEPSASD